MKVFFKCLVLLLLLSAPKLIIAQCNAKIGGFYFYCNPDTPDSFFVGFTISNLTGDYLISDNNTNILALNQSIYDDTQGKNANYTYPGDVFNSSIAFSSVETYYFQIGPYENGSTVDLIMTDQNNNACVIPIYSDTYSCAGEASSGCSVGVPYYSIDFNNVNNEYFIMGRSRVSTCCEMPGGCFEFQIEIGAGIAALSYELVGAQGGDIGSYNNSAGTFMNANPSANTCDTPLDTVQSMLDPLCINEPGTYIIYACKSGENVNGVAISGIPPLQPPSYAIKEGCIIDSVIIDNAANIVWSSEEDPGLNNLSCDGSTVSTCNIPSFQFNSGVFGSVTSCDGAEFYYKIEVTPELSLCTDVLVDSVYFKVYPNFIPDITANCTDDPNMVELAVLIDDGGLDCGYYTYEWLSNGSTESTLLAPLDGNEYSVVIGIDDPNYISNCYDTLTITTPLQLYTVDCNGLNDSLLACIDELPAENIDLIGYTSFCDVTPLITSSDFISGGAGCTGDETFVERTYTIDFDANLITTGDQYTCVQTFTIRDTISPSFDAPADIVIDCEIDADVTITGGVMNVSDNCSIQDTFYIDFFIPGLCANTGLIQRSWQVRDICGNTTIHTQNISIQDTTKPTFVLPPDITIDCEASIDTSNTGVVSSVTDNCSISDTIFSDMIIPGSCAQEDTIKRTWTIIDACDNSTSLVQTILVQDTTRPVITMCISDITVSCDGNTDPSATGMPTATDNCTASEDLIITYMDDQSGGTCSGDEPIIRTWMITDECGNTITCEQTIIITDTEKPTYTPVPDVTIDCEIIPDVSITGDVTDAADNCALLSVTYDDFIIDGPNCNNTRIIERTWIASDICGNDSISIQTITVQDTTKPTFTVPADITINCEVPADISVTGGVNDEDDNCGAGIATYSDQTNLSECNNTGMIVRTWTLEDNCGNSVSYDQIITVQDTTKPTFTVPADITINCEVPADITITGDVDDEDDNCGTGEATFNDVANLGGCNGTGTITRTWTLEDNCGNRVSYDQIITVQDTTKPSFTIPVDITIDCEVPADISVTGGVNDEFDNCSTNTATFSDVENLDGCNGTGTITRTWTLMDDCGNSVSYDQIITVQDTTKPSFTVPADITINCEIPADISVTGGVSDEFDNCSNNTATFSDVENLDGCNGTGTITRTWTLMDDCSNAVSYDQIITIQDTTKPVITLCIPDITVSCDGSTDPNETGMPTATDNCTNTDELIITYMDDSNGGTCSGDSPIIRTWRIEDACGNFITCTQSILITDTDKPTYTPVPDITINCEIPVDVSITGDVTDATDNCALLEVTFEDVIIDGPNCNNSRIIERTWTASDICGNDSVSVQLITVQDTTRPEFSVPGDITVNCQTSVDTSITGSIFNVIENCGVADTSFTDLVNLSECNGTGTIERTWTVTDACDNATSLVQIITVQDTTKPTFTVPNDITIKCEVPTDVSITGDVEDESDNCGVGEATFTDVHNLSGCNNTGTITRTWMLADGCNNITTQVQIITIQDTTPPTFTVPADITIDCGVPADISVTGDVEDGADDCGSGEAIFTDVSDLTGCNGTGTIIRTWTLEDECGNMIAQDQIITIQDTTRPEVIFPIDVTILCEDDPDNLGVTGDVYATDNCTVADDLIIGYIDEVSLEGCGGTGNISRTWTVEDLCGNQSVWIQSILVEDVTPPEFIIPGNITINCYEDYLDLMLTGDVETIESSCDIGLIISHMDNVFLGGCNNTGYVEREWTVADNCGNSETQSQFITVVDTTAPVAVCLDITIELDENGEAVIDIDMVDGGSYDCGSIERSLSTELFSCASGLSETITLMVEDECGNVSACDANVTVLDNLAPVLSCMDDITYQLEPGQCEIAVEFAEPTGSDNCSYEITRIDNLGLNSGDNFPVGWNTLVYEISDPFGNTSRCAFEIFIQNYNPGSFACLGQINISLDENCEYLLTPEDVLAGETYGCLDSYTVDVATGTPENPNIIPGSPLITKEYIGQNLIFIISDPTNNLTCWGYVLVEDKMAPIIKGQTYELACDSPILPDSIGFPTEDTTGIVKQNGFYIVPNGLDNCTEAKLNYNDSIIIFECSNIYTKTIFRKWYAEDRQGYPSYGYDTIHILRPMISDLALPPNLDGIQAPYLVCEDKGSKWDTLSNGNPAPSSSGAVEGLMCSDILVRYKDTRFEVCEDQSCFKVLREWEIMDWCSGDIVNHQQIIKVLDDKAPIISPVDDITITTNEDCRGEIHLPNPEITDNCSISISSGLKSSDANIVFDEINNLYHVSELLQGVTELYYYAEDCCGNIAYDTVQITVVDDTPPVAICHEHTVLSLSNQFKNDTVLTSAKMWAESLDDGSYDNCGKVWLKVMRMDENLCNSAQGSTFDDYVEFCCDDIGNEVMVILRVFEEDPGNGPVEIKRMEKGGDLYGTYTDCMATVTVQDKIAPTIIAPSDMTISCDAWYDEDSLKYYFGDIAINNEQRDSIFITDRACPQEFLYDPKNPYQVYQMYKGIEGLAYDVCEITIEEKVESNYTCGEGYIKRTFTATDINGNSSTAVQRITIENCTPFYISDIDCENKDSLDGVIWPCHFYSDDCAFNPNIDPSVTGEPIIPFEFCQIIGIQYTDKIFEKNGRGCTYILREWRIIDECHFDIDLDDYHEIEYRYYQEILFQNNIAPEIINCEDLDIGFNQGCQARLEYNIIGNDDCTEEERLSYTHIIDYNNDGIFEDSVSSGTLNVLLDGGEHRVRWYVFDGCANVGSCDQIITVSDKKSPTPYCYNGLSTSIDVEGEVIEFWASDFDRGSFDDCSNPVTVSFSEDITDNKLEISCASLENFPLDTLFFDLWVTDASGNQDVCRTFLRVHVKDEVCEPEETGNITGIIHDYRGNMINDVEVSLESSYMLSPMEDMTEQGNFEFRDVKMYHDYMVTPFKNTNPLEGVSTLDLVIIQRHILGLEQLSNPYLLIAADINNNGKITAADLLELRKLILGYNTSFNNNTSWRFVDANFRFPDANNPWGFSEQKPVYQLSKDEFQDWIGMKTGDVNGTISTLDNHSLTLRTKNPIAFNLSYSKGIAHIEMDQLETVNLNGFQLELEIEGNHEELTLQSKLEGFGADHYRISNIGENTLIRISYHSNYVSSIKEIVQISGLNPKFAANIKLSDHFEHEGYDENNTIRHIELRYNINSDVASDILKSSPNPFTEKTVVTYRVTEDGWVSLKLFGIDGSLVEQSSAWHSKGLYTKSYEMRDQESGIYFLQMETKTGFESIKLMKIR